MNWANVIIEGLPPRRGNEPGSLRGDIADELADHLACALSRELRRTDDPAAAEKAVLTRFGNPATVARRLWWDAMKENIVKDRIMIAVMVVLVVLALGASLLTWQSLREGRQFNAVMLARLEQLARSPEPAKPAVPDNWAKAVVRVMEKGGKPLSGMYVSLIGSAFTEKGESLRVRTDAEGTARFGPVRPGKFSVQAYRGPTDIGTEGWAPPSEIRSVRDIILYAGQEEEVTFTYPRPPGAEIKFNLDPAVESANPSGADMLIECHVQSSITVEGTTWDLNPTFFLTAHSQLAQGAQQSQDRYPVIDSLGRRQSNFMACWRNAGQVTPTAMLPAGSYSLRQIRLFARRSDQCFAVMAWSDGMQPVQFDAKDGANEWAIPISEKMLKDFAARLEATNQAELREKGQSAASQPASRPE